MEGDVGDDPVVQDTSSEVSPHPETGTSSGSSSTGTVKLNKLHCDNVSEEPQPTPGPSNSAADFDLEVFDSGSSCSNEECWEVDEKGSKVKLTSASTSKENKMSEIVKIESTPSSHQQNLMSSTGGEVCESECESETEDMEMENQEVEQEEEGEEEMEDVVPETGDDNETETEEAVVSLLPSETLDRKESVELWKSRNETDVIVSDHDVFGLHEGEEDSLDSLVLRPDIDSSYDINDDTTMSSDILISSLGHIVSHQSSFLLEQEESEGSARPKRKSGSLSELKLPVSQIVVWALRCL